MEQGTGVDLHIPVGNIEEPPWLHGGCQSTGLTDSGGFDSHKNRKKSIP